MNAPLDPGEGSPATPTDRGTAASATHVVPPAEIDPDTASSFQERLDAVPADRDVVVDFGAVTFCDSTGLRVLILAARRHESAGGRLRVANVHPRVARVFTVTGLQGLLLESDGADPGS